MRYGFDNQVISIEKGRPRRAALLVGPAAQAGIPDRRSIPQRVRDDLSKLPSLELDGAAGILDLLLDLLGFVLVDAFLDGLGRALDQRLRLAEAKPGDRADFLDHVDLLAAVAGQDDVEFGLFFGGRGSRPGGGRSGGNRRRGRD